MSVLLISLLICLFIKEATHRIKFSKRKQNKIRLKTKFISILNIFEIRKFSAIGILIFFINQFIWLNQLFIANNIKTNKVVVDTSDLMQTEQDLFNTRRVACFLDKEKEMNLATDLTNKNILTRIYNEKTKFRADQVKERKLCNNERCLFPRDLRTIDLIDSDLYSIGSKTLFNFFLAFFAQFNANKKMWKAPKPIQQYNSVFYYNLRNSLNKFYWKEYERLVVF